MLLRTWSLRTWLCAAFACLVIVLAVALVAGGRGRLAVVVLLMLLVACVPIGYYLVRRVSRPLEQLDNAVARYTDSGFADASAIYSVREDVPEVAGLKNSLQALSVKLQHQLDQITQNDRLRRELLANLSHDLRSPLASMQGYLETVLIKDADIDAAQQREYVRIAHRQAQRLNRLVQDLFELARLDSAAVQPKWENFSLAELLQDVIQAYAADAKRRGVELQLLLDASDKQQWVTADIGLLERVFENLISNALRYTPADGVISIGVTPKAGRVLVYVADTGCGIEQQRLPGLFDRHTDAEHQRPADGSGLGLAIVKRILELHDSQIVVHSTVDVGTRFEFSLPIGMVSR